MEATDELIELIKDGRKIGWMGLDGRVIPFINGAATDEEDEDEDEDEDESEEDESEEDEDEDEEEEEEEEPKLLTEAEVRRIASKEKKDGRRSGRDQVLKELGLKSVEDGKRKLKSPTKPPAKGAKDDETDDDSDRESEREDIQKERKQSRLDGRAERALIAAGAPESDKVLAGILVMLDLDVEDDPSPEDITTAVEDLKEENPALFGAQTAKKKVTPKSSVGGRGGRKPKVNTTKGKALLDRRHPNRGNSKD